jgi:DDE superfamily endonuclease
VIAPEQNSSFVAAMEQVLDVYKRQYNKRYPVINMDESPKQLIAESKIPLPAKPGQERRYDYEYVREGVCNIFLASEALQGKRYVKVTEQNSKKDWAIFMKEIADKHYPEAKKITVIMDNLPTHTPGALYEVFEPSEAKRILDRFGIVYTPKHGSWLNIAEIELNVLMNQCLRRRIANINTIKKEVAAWQKHRNNKISKINWRFKTEDARIKLKRLYPKLHD